MNSACQALIIKNRRQGRLFLQVLVKTVFHKNHCQAQRARYGISDLLKNQLFKGATPEQRNWIAEFDSASFDRPLIEHWFKKHDGRNLYSRKAAMYISQSEQLHYTCEYQLTKVDDLAAPASGSGTGWIASKYILDSVQGQAALINQLLGNVIIFVVFSVGGAFLASAIGLYIQQNKNNRKYAFGTSFASTQLTNSILPFIAASVMLNNVQTLDLQPIINNYLLLMLVCGIAFLAAAYLLFQHVK